MKRSRRLETIRIAWDGWTRGRAMAQWVPTCAFRTTSRRKRRLVSSVQITLASQQRAANDWLYSRLAEMQHAAAGNPHLAWWRGGRGNSGAGAQIERH